MQVQATAEAPAIDEARVNEVMEQAVGLMSGLGWFLLTAIGLRTGLWSSLAGAGPVTPHEAATRAGLAEPYVREWLKGQAAAGFVRYDPADDTFDLADEVALLFADPDSPAHIGGFIEVGLAFNTDWELVAKDFATGRGVGWHEHSPQYWEGLDALARPVIGQYLTSTWVPALDGVDAKLRAGGRVADIGCGFGHPSIVIAEAYPHAIVHGYDYHDEAIVRAGAAAAERGLDDRMHFEVADASRFTGSGFDLVLFIDSLHDLGDPVGALRHARAALAPGGTVFLVEPAGGDRLEDNFHPLGILSYTASVLACTPNSRLKRRSAPS